MSGLAALLLLLLPEVVLPRPTELTAAAGDTVELERLSTRLGPARMVALFEDAATRRRRQPGLMQAALHGIGLMGAAHPDIAMQLLPPLTGALSRLGRAQRLDDKQMAAAAEALRRTTSALGLSAADAASADADGADYEPGLRDVAERLFELGTDAALPLPLREGALESMAALPPSAWQHLVPRLIQLAQAPQQEQQRRSRGALAALAALVPRDRPEPLVDLVRTAEPTLASEAAAELCGALPPRKGAHPAPLFSEEVAGRLRALAAPEQPLPQRVSLVECLRLLGTPADRALYQGIVSAARKKGPR